MTNSIHVTRRGTIVTILCILAVALLTTATQAATININWIDDGRPGYTGEGILTLGDTTGVWNNHSVVGDNPVPASSASALLDSEGNSTSVNLGRTGGRFLYFLAGGGTDDQLYNGGLVDNAMAVTISGLTPGDYKVAAMGKYNANLIEFNIDGGTSQTVGNGLLNNTDPQNWAVFDITVGGSGSFTLNVPNIAGESVFNAMQIQDVPEPASMAILAMGGIGVLIRRRRA